MIEAVLFDLDGTLIDTNQLIIDSFEHTFKTHFPNLQLTRETYISFIGPTLDQTFAQYTDHIEDCIKTYRSFNFKHHDEYVIAYPHAKDVLEKLKAMNVKIAIVTSKRYDIAMRGLKLANLDTYIDAFVGFEDVTFHKPHPEAPFLALKKLKVLGEAMMVGDSGADILAAKAAGCYSVGVAWSLKQEEMKQTQPDVIIHDMREIISLLERRNNDV